MDQATAHTFHTRLLHHVSDVPTRTGAAMRDVITAHRPEEQPGLSGPSWAGCAGGSLGAELGDCWNAGMDRPAAYPCSTTRVVAGSLRVDIPAAPVYGGTA